ncbi:MAG: hypothetical protein J0H74_35690 [Chitinophagaceae bacterium]|nr:hypothetical protein [Chitinophagaceae bacterium]
MVNKGATTMWEKWNGTLPHVFFNCRKRHR